MRVEHYCEIMDLFSDGIVYRKSRSSHHPADVVFIAPGEDSELVCVFLPHPGKKDSDASE
jgi:hypothetical protein